MIFEIQTKTLFDAIENITFIQLSSTFSFKSSFILCINSEMYIFLNSTYMKRQNKGEDVLRI